MREIKATVSPKDANGLAIPRIIIAVLCGGMIAAVLMMAVEKFLEFCLVPAELLGKLEAIIQAVGGPLTVLFTALYIFRTLRRRYAYCYMQDYAHKLRNNGYTTCPRCGSGVVEKKRQRTYSHRIGERIRTRTYSDGRTEVVERTGITEMRSYTETYHQCTNPACAIIDDEDLKFGRLPYSRKDLRALILMDAPNAKEGIRISFNKKRTRRILLIVLLIAAIVIACLSFRSQMKINYDRFGGKAPEGVTASAPLGEEEKAFIAKVRSVINNTGEYGLSVSKLSNGPFGKDKDIDIYYFIDEKFGNGYTVEFEELKSDTGLKGDYTLMPYNGQVCIFNDKDKTIYSPDTDFYKTHYEAIAKWTGKQVLLSLVDQITTGELYEKYTDMYILRSDKMSVFIAEDGSVQLLDDRGKASMRYIFFADDIARPEDYADYKPLGYQPPEMNKLETLLNKAGYEADIDFYQNGEDIGELEVLDNGDGSYTFRNGYDPISTIPTGEYTLYPAEKRFEYIPYADSDLYHLSDKVQHYTAASNATTYNWLVGMIPKDFVRTHINLDNAKKKSLFSFAELYTEEREDGSTAELRRQGKHDIDFGYEDSNGYRIEISW